MVRMLNYVIDPIPDTLDDFALASQIAQGEALKFHIERWRLRTDTGGLLWWNLRDGWPIFSDAVVDFYNRKKLAYYYIQRVQQDVVVACGEAENERHPLCAINDTRCAVSGQVRVTDADSGACLLAVPFTANPGERVQVGQLPSVTATACWLIDWELADGTTGRNHYLAGPLPVTLAAYRRWLGMLQMPVEIATRDVFCK
jgi:beta-mannosidase